MLSMIDKRYLNAIKRRLHTYASARRTVIGTSGDALHHAKRAIFSLHRGNAKEAKQKIASSEKLLGSLGKLNKKIDVEREGSYKAALEEYVEAVLFYRFVMGEKSGKITSIDVPDDVYLAGLCDVPGELYRYAVRAATNDDLKTVKRCEDAAQEIIGELVEFDLTKYLRNKYDQAKRAMQKLEIIQYELHLKK